MEKLNLSYKSDFFIKYKGMVAHINQLIAIFIIIFVTAYYLYCATNKQTPSIESVLKICSAVILIFVAVILLRLPFQPELVEWIKQATLPLTIVGVLMITLVIRSAMLPNQESNRPVE